MESEVFLVRIFVNTQMRLSLSFWCQFPVLWLVRTQSHRRRSAICITSVLSSFQSLSQLALHFSSLLCTCNLISNTFKLVQDIVPRRKCVAWQRSTVPVHDGSSSGTVASSAGADTARIVIEQIRILTLQAKQRIGGRSSGNNHSAGCDKTGSHSQMPKVNHQFGKDIIPNILDGKQRNDFREWAAYSALYLSAQCVDACEILLEWLASDKEHVIDTEIQTRCHAECWENDNINTFSRVTFVYLSMRTTGLGKKIMELSVINWFSKESSMFDARKSTFLYCFLKGPSTSAVQRSSVNWEREGIVGGDEGPVGGVVQVVSHGVKVVGVHGEEGQGRRRTNASGSKRRNRAIQRQTFIVHGVKMGWQTQETTRANVGVTYQWETRTRTLTQIEFFLWKFLVFVPSRSVDHWFYHGAATLWILGRCSTRIRSVLHRCCHNLQFLTDLTPAILFFQVSLESGCWRILPKHDTQSEKT